MEKLKVMVVDDESRMRKLVRDFLVRQDFDVIEAGDGEQAVDLFFEEKDIALIIYYQYFQSVHTYPHLSVVDIV